MVTTVGKRVLARATVPTVRAATGGTVIQIITPYLAFTFLQKESCNPLGIHPVVGVMTVGPVSALVALRSSLICVWSRKS